MSNKQDAKEAREEIERYWTPERIATAKPRIFTSATRPKPDPRPVAPEVEQRDLPGYNPTPESSAPQMAAPVNDPTQYPWRTVGKLYFTAGGVNYVGTAYSIYTNTLLTAAHNIYLNGQWSTNFYFVPALLSNGQQPYGYWTYSGYVVLQDWINIEQSAAYDVGIIWLNSGGRTNQPIGGVVGYLGLTFNRTVPRDWFDTGYPGAEQQMYTDQGQYTRSYDNGLTVGKVGNLASGVSGGPWLLYGDINTSNGIHSESLTATEKLSPYFRDAIGQFIQNNLR
jgi:V8-like Glu-specific endopeptidase